MFQPTCLGPHGEVVLEYQLWVQILPLPLSRCAILGKIHLP